MARLVTMNSPVIYPGTFDPITNGHLDVITRAAHIFPQIIVAVAANLSKAPCFSCDERVRMTQESVQHLPKVTVKPFEQLLIDFAEEQGATIILRGLRAVADFEYELQLAGMNRKLNKTIETIFLPPSEHSMFISSTLVREIVALGGDVTAFVPEAVARAYKA
ncbi:MAG: pantetheine-phosphate adenylyltransferase [Gammaproteobacteria bacterium]|nr:pantetheine-phosphate adenylyltransferase [Gammaproteobacteria bacterium]